MNDVATMLIGVSSDYLHDGVNLEVFRMNVNFALESIDRQLKSEKQAIEAVKGWIGESVKCNLCSYEWVAVRHEDSDRLECPNCENIVHFESEEVD